MNLGSLLIQAEYQGSWNQDSAIPGKAIVGTTYFQGYYVQALYWLTGEMPRWDKKEARPDRPLVRTNLAPGACVLLVNWLGQSDDPCNGDEAAGRFIAATTGSLHVARQLRQPGYRLDLLVPA